MTSNIYRLGQIRCTGVKMYINPLFPSLFWMKCGCAVKVETLKMWLNDQCNIKKQVLFFMEGQFDFLTGLTVEREDTPPMWQGVGKEEVSSQLSAIYRLCHIKALLWHKRDLKNLIREPNI